MTNPYLDGFCRENTLKKTLLFFNKTISQNEFLQAKSINNVINTLKKQNMQIYIYIPVYYLISPKMLLLYIKNYKKITLDNQLFKNIINKLNVHRKSIIYFVSAYEFYNINELWTHYFVEMFYGDTRTIYDSFIENYTSDDYNSLRYFEHPSHIQLLNLYTLKVAVWDKN